MKDIRVTIVQSNIIWEDIGATLAHLEMLLQKIKPDDTDLVILPEMFSTGFSMNAKHLSEQIGGKTMRWMAKKASEKKCALTGSIIIEDTGMYFNRLIWMKSDGEYEFYDKRHLFKMAEEHLTYTPGNKKNLTSIKGWRILPLICYDLRFPVWCRNTGDYDVLVFVACWPEVRITHWQQLLKARAIENQCYVAGVNGVGKDGKGLKYGGCSMLLNPNGDIVSDLKLREEDMQTSVLSGDALKEFRKNLPFLEDRDEFTINYNP